MTGPSDRRSARDREMETHLDALDAVLLHQQIESLGLREDWATDPAKARALDALRDIRNQLAHGVGGKPRAALAVEARAVVAEVLRFLAHLEQSSLGTPGVRRIRRATPAEKLNDINTRAKEISELAARRADSRSTMTSPTPEGPPPGPPPPFPTGPGPRARSELAAASRAAGDAPGAPPPSAPSSTPPEWPAEHGAPQLPPGYAQRLLERAGLPTTSHNVFAVQERLGIIFTLKARQFIEGTGRPGDWETFVERAGYASSEMNQWPQRVLNALAQWDRDVVPHIQDFLPRYSNLLLEKDGFLSGRPSRPLPTATESSLESIAQPGARPLAAPL